MSEHPPMIVIEDLRKTFGDVHAVDGLDLRVPAGELFCFLGPNGAGKTTTIKMLCGLLKPGSGRIVIRGMDLHEHAQEVKKITGYIPDQPYLYERLTAAEFYEFTGDLYGIPRDEIRAKREKAFELFGLEDYQDSLIKNMSHGIRQRLCYASVFLHDPAVLFIDEPFIGLDPYSIRLIKNLLREKCAAGATIFLTTHILALAEDMADRIGIIDSGRLVALGTLHELMRQTDMQGRLEDVFLKLTE